MFLHNIRLPLKKKRITNRWSDIGLYFCHSVFDRGEYYCNIVNLLSFIFAKWVLFIYFVYGIAIWEIEISAICRKIYL